jgi:hypothetical protein
MLADMKTSQICNRKSINNTGLENLFDERVLARITGRSVASIRRDRLLGKGCPFVKLQHLVRYRPQDARDYIQRNVRGANGEAR